MGRRTWQSIGRVLPGRRNIVVSRSLRTVPITRGPQPVDPSPELFKDIGSALASCQDTKELFVIGGGEIYARLLPWTDRVIATEVKGKYSGDTWFPPLYPGEWQMHKYDRQPSENGFEFAFVEYRRAGFHYPLSEGQS
jgi:dihydrofolate reductase